MVADCRKTPLLRQGKNKLAEGFKSRLCIHRNPDKSERAASSGGTRERRNKPASSGIGRDPTHGTFKTARFLLPTTHSWIRDK